MITTRFLARSEYPEYASWLKATDAHTKRMFFGYSITDEGIDELVEKFVQDAGHHYFLVAEENCKWVGTLHIAVTGKEVEFGFIVAPDYRGKRISSTLMTEGIIWARNRGFDVLFLHCLVNNHPIKHLCKKHGLEVTTDYGESETKMPLPPPTLVTIAQETFIRQGQMWRMLLRPYI